ncbi:unnamed protein product (mitochondrion) [Plasmodiophora brassicae]|uniref:Uncharacterized protein n=1 Tax=Plasmodiophora brassicae TaxID=37360 RepID=A0A3P3YBE3_PLABS|nr:unnamed protein product [Plasmodiophora brassicae]
MAPSPLIFAILVGGSRAVMACRAGVVAGVIIVTVSAWGAAMDGGPIGVTDLGQYPSLQLDPVTRSIVVVYGSAWGLKMTTCDAEQCDTESKRSRHLGCTPPLAAASLTFVRNRPFIAFAPLQSGNAATLYGMSCSDSSCAAFTTTKIGSTSNVGFAAAALVGANGLPLVAYMDKTRNSLAVATCLTDDCRSSHVTFPYKLGGFYHSYGSTDIVTAGNTTIISFQQWNPNGTTGTLQLCVCDQGTCDAPRIVTLDESASEYSSVALDHSGNLLVAYADESYSILQLAVCSTSSLVAKDCTIRTLMNSAQAINWPVIRCTSRSLPVGGGLPIIAFFQAWEGGVGGALLVFKCAAPLCIDDTDQCVDASVVDESPLWIVSEMQISMVLRPSDGRPVITYSVYEAPNSFYLKLAICDSPSCEYSSTYEIDSFKDVTLLTLKFNVSFFIAAEIVVVVVTVVSLMMALYTPNKARLVNVYTMLPFTRDIIVDARYRNALGVSAMFSIAGAFLSSFSWLLYCGPENFFAYWHVFFLSLVPIGSSVMAYMAICNSCNRRNLLWAGSSCIFSLVVVLTLIVTYAVNSDSFECNTINITVPRALSVVGVAIVACTQLIGVFLCSRLYMALGLASPALLGNQWEDDI